jgi:hypothetical protein
MRSAGIVANQDRVSRRFAGLCLSVILLLCNDAGSQLLKNRAALNVYLGDVELNTDNNASERSVRAEAIGRQNRMFYRSVRRGKTAAVLVPIVDLPAPPDRPVCLPARYLPAHCHASGYGTRCAPARCLGATEPPDPPPLKRQGFRRTNTAESPKRLPPNSLKGRSCDRSRLLRPQENRAGNAPSARTQRGGESEACKPPGRSRNNTLSRGRRRV